MIYKLILIILLVIFENSFVFSQIDTIYHENGKVEWIGKSVDNKRVGHWTRLDSIGNIVKKVNYLKNGYFKAERIEFRGKDIFRFYYQGFTDKNGKEVINGKYQIYLNNELMIFTKYRGGLYSGVYKYYSNRKLQLKCFYKNNIKQGQYIEFYENGKIKVKGNYLNDKKTGKWKQFYENGQLTNEGFYCSSYYIVQYDNFSDFTFKVLDENNNIVLKDVYPFQVIEYLNYIRNEARNFDLPQIIFLKDKRWKYWEEDGTLIKVENYNKGELLEMIKY